MEINKVGNFSRDIPVVTKRITSEKNFEKYLESAKSDDKQKLKEVCKEFEGVMLDMMYKQMRSSVPKSELLSGGFGGQVFEEMLDEKLTEEASKGRGIGLADILYKQMSR